MQLQEEDNRELVNKTKKLQRAKEPTKQKKTNLKTNYL